VDVERISRHADIGSGMEELEISGWKRRWFCPEICENDRWRFKKPGGKQRAAF